ncbi:MAG: type II toxin-antitoxin system VapC family toxin [Planctomycetota bacterium]
MSFVIDTDVCSAYLKGDCGVWQRFMQYGGRLHLSSITVGELFTWALRAQAPPKRLPALVDLLNDVTVLDVTIDVSRKFGELRAALLDAGQAAPDMDLLIAATALVHHLTLVTHNGQDFANLPGLSIEDWLSR